MNKAERNENNSKWQASRRRLLKLMGAAGATAIAAPFLPSFLAKARASSPEANGEKPVRLRRWAMVIDLRKCDGCQSQGTPPQCTEACVEGHYVPEPMEWIQCYEKELLGG